MKRATYTEMRAPNTPLKRVAASMLLFSFMFSPLSFVFAEEPTEVHPPETTIVEITELPPSNPESETLPEETPAEVPIDTSEEEMPSEEGKQPLEPEPQAMMSGGTQTETGSLFINNETTKSAAPEVDTQTGALQFGYEFTIPPGRNGLQPDLKLQYSSNAIGNTSVFGYGWSLSIPSISRSNKFGTDKLYTSDTFTSSLDGELVRVGTTTSFKPRVENGSFREYTFASSTWIVIEKDGTRMSFGSSTAAQRADTASSTRIYSWELEEIRDTNDNFVRYNYYKDAGQIYPESISYTGNASTTGPFLIEFTRESRGDNLVSYETGFVATTTYRIKNIKASIDSSWVFSYDLNYSTGHNGNRSLLSSIAKTGKEEVTGVEKTLPATNFTYETYGAGDKQWEQESEIIIPVDIVGSVSQPETGARFVDINGDALPDILRSYGSNPIPSNPTPYGISQEVYLHTGDGWATSTEWTIPSPANGRFGFATGFFGYGPELAYSGQGVDFGARFADVNADGYTDILWAYNTDALSIMYGIEWHYRFRDVYINNKVNGWATTTNWEIPDGISFGSDVFPGSSRIADVNGDGLPDLINSNCISGGETYLNTGAGWVQAATSTWVVPEPLSCNGSDVGTQVVDVNADGLADVIRSLDFEDNDNPDYPRINKVYLNNGNGWVHAPSWTIPVALTLSRINSYSIHALSPRLVDVNGDNLTDIIRSSEAPDGFRDGSNVYLNTGEGWSEDSEWTTPPYFKFIKTTNNSTFQVEAGYAEMDFNGDNVIDFVKSGIINNGSPFNYYPREEVMYLHEGKVPDLLSKIEYPEGGELSIGFEQSTRFEENGIRINNHLASNLNTVERITFDDGVSDPYDHSYVYGGGENYFASSTERKFAGFATTTMTDSRGNTTTTYIHQGNGSQASLGENSDSYEKIGKPYLTEVRDENENLYTRSLYRWDTQSTGSSTAFVFNSQEIHQQYDGDSDHKDIAVGRIYDAVGNIATSTEWGEVVASTTNGLFSDTGSDKRATSYTYATGTNSRLTDLPVKTVVFDQSGTRVRESNSYYDSLPYGTASKGNVTKSTNWVNGTTYNALSRTFDSYGLITSVIDSRGATTTYTFDAKHLYPTSVINALLHVASSTYDYSSGKAKLVINNNGYSSESIFDGLDRLITQKEPDPTSGSNVTTRTNTYVDTRNHVSVAISNFLTASTSADSYKYFDGFGNLIQERTETEDTSVYSVKDWVFGDEGFLEKESLPYFSGDENATDVTTEDKLLVVYSYDPLGRKVSIENAVGVSDISYDDWNEITTDALGRQKEFSYDAYKRLVFVTEHNASSTYETEYVWNANNNLTQITDALGNVRLFEYDGIGNRTLAEDLHSVGDGTYGTWLYAYDAAGNLATTTDPTGQVIVRSFDLINRPLSENFTGNAGIEIAYGYDTCSNGIGFLCTATSSGAVSRYTYTPNGLTQSESKTIDSVNYTASTTYDRQGNKVELTYPDGFKVQYSYNSAGQLEAVTQKENASSTLSPVVVDFDYAPTGEVSYKELASGIATTWTYDPDALYRLAHIYTASIHLDQDTEEASLLDESESFRVENESVYLGIASSSQVFEEQNSEDNFQFEEQSDFTLASSSSNKLIASTTDERADYSSRFKSHKAQLLGAHALGNGMIEYAYKTDISLDTIPATKATLDRAAKEKFLLGNEVVEMRTANSRTYSTSKPELFVTEVVSGAPQYVEDANGNWWGIDYGVVPENTYKKEIGNSVSYDSPRSSVATSTAPETLSKGSISYNNLPICELETNEQENLLAIIGEFFVTKRAYAATATTTSALDGYVRNDAANSSWSTVRNGTTGTSVNYTATGGDDPYTWIASGKYNNRRTYFLFDTSAIPDSNTVTSATFSVYKGGSGVSNANSTTLELVQTNPASDTVLTTSDYDNLSFVSGSSKSINSFTDNARTEMVLNSTGKTWINKTGYTKLGLITGLDLNNTAPTGINGVANIGFSENTGTTYDPMLVVVHDITNNAPTAPIALETNGQTNPTNLVGSNLRFSAVYQDPDTTDTARYYRLQISTSTVFSNTIWDSGKTAIATTSVGSRTPEVVHDGSGLATSTLYYWRIKLWDQADAESAWSTATSSFIVTDLEYRVIQDLYFGYDAVGNITSVTNAEDFEHPVATLYTYDDLNRLISAATTTADLGFSDGPITIQPDGTTGKDTFYGTTYVTSGGPNEDFFRIGGWSDSYYSYLQFPLSDIEDYENIESAELSLYQTNTNSANDMKLERITESWTESGVSNSSNPASVDIGMSWQTLPNGDWITVDVTQLVKDWKAGVYPNYGVKIVGHYYSGDQVKAFRSSDYSDSSYRPKLVIETSHDTSSIPDITFGTTTATTSTYSYNALGNIFTNSLVGTYSYGGIGYANPHAATGIASTTLTYDQNGNLSSEGSDSYTWDYRNRLASSLSGATTTGTYSYDHADKRVKKVSGGVSSLYPFGIYSKAGATTTRSIFDRNNAVIATIDSNGISTTTFYNHPDHLGSLDSVTHTGGGVTQTIDYQPYGSIAQRSGADVSQREYIGEIYDGSTELSYLNARYYDGTRGQFLSQDPSFLAMGDPKKLKELTQQELNQILMDPQTLNSYSYARNNPIINKDPSGNWYVYINGGLTYGFFNVQIGFEANDQGVNAVAGVGPSLGAEAKVGGGFSSGSMPKNAEVQVEQSAGGAVGVGYKYSKSATVNLKDGTNAAGPKQDVSSSHNLQIGVGAAVSQTYTAHIPIIPGSMIQTTPAPTTPVTTKPTTPETKNKVKNNR